MEKCDPGSYLNFRAPITFYGSIFSKVFFISPLFYTFRITLEVKFKNNEIYKHQELGFRRQAP
jgi:hypothetical protein